MKLFFAYVSEFLHGLGTFQKIQHYWGENRGGGGGSVDPQVEHDLIVRACLRVIIDGLYLRGDTPGDMIKRSVDINGFSE